MPEDLLRPYHLLAALLFGATVADAQPVTPPRHGGPQPGQVDAVGRDAGPALQPPRTDSPHAVNRGTDGSAAGLNAPGATGTTPQGMLGGATAGAREAPTPPANTPPTTTPGR